MRVAIVTGGHYIHTLPLIADLGKAGVNVVVCSKSDEVPPVGFYSKWCGESHQLPSEGYVEELIALCKDVKTRYKVTPVLLPCDRFTIRSIASAEVLTMLNEHAYCECNLLDTLDMLSNKDASYDFCKRLDIPVPRQVVLKCDTVDYSAVEHVGYPCVVKAVDGERFGLYAKDRVRKVNSVAELETVLDFFEERTHDYVVVQEFLPGKVMTFNFVASCGDILSYTGEQHIRMYPILSGKPTCCELCVNDKIVEYSKEIIKASKFSGLICIQFIPDCNGVEKFIEINTRMYGGYGIQTFEGSQLSLHWFAALWNKANPDSYYEPPAAQHKYFKCYDFPSDGVTALCHAKAGNMWHLFDFFHNIVSPRAHVRNIGWEDLKPSIVAMASSFYRHFIKK